MKRFERTGLVLTLALGAAAGFVAARYMDVQRVSAQEAAARQATEAALTTRFPAAASVLEVFSLAAKVASPSVVHITRKTGGEVYRDWIGFRYWVPESESVGSGVVVSADGNILTNNHVVEGAKEISVRFVDGHTVRGKVMGADPETDLAVVKITPPREFTLQPARLGNSDALQVGEWVLAIGSPFGLDHTVTSGIVSALGRRQSALPVEDYIQTDAAINPGNSGGALVNLKGEVVGINSAIVTQTGNFAGVGFAIPIGLANRVMEGLVKNGRVRRGFLGVEVRNLDETLAERYSYDGVDALLKELKLDSPRGAFVAGFAAAEGGSPAKDAGFREGDVILEFDGRPVKDVEDLIARIVQTPPGTKVAAKVWRGGKETTVTATMGERPAQDDPRKKPRRR